LDSTALSCLDIALHFLPFPSPRSFLIIFFLLLSRPSSPLNPFSSSQNVVKSFKKASKAKQSQAVAATQDAISGREAAVKLQEELLAVRRQLQTQETETATRCASLTADLNEARKALNQNKDELEALRGAMNKGDGAGMGRGKSEVTGSGTGGGLGAGVGTGVVVESHQLRELTVQLKATEEQLERQISATLVSHMPSSSSYFLLSLLFFSLGGRGRRGLICIVCGMSTTVDHVVDVIVFDQSNERLI
jgi:hypothetical protein